jgi:hypothetical protein
MRPNLHTLRPNARPNFADFAEIVLAMNHGNYIVKESEAIMPATNPLKK